MERRIEVTRKKTIIRLPRKRKKLIKSVLGEQGYINWLNEKIPMIMVLGEPKKHTDENGKEIELRTLVGFKNID